MPKLKDDGCEALKSGNDRGVKAVEPVANSETVGRRLEFVNRQFENGSISAAVTMPLSTEARHRASEAESEDGIWRENPRL